LLELAVVVVVVVVMRRFFSGACIVPEVSLRFGAFRCVLLRRKDDGVIWRREVAWRAYADMMRSLDRPVVMMINEGE